MSLLIYGVYYKGFDGEEDELERQFQTKEAANKYAMLLNNLNKISSFYSDTNYYVVKPMEINDEFEYKFPIGVKIVMGIEKAGTKIKIDRELAVCKCDFIYDEDIINENKVPIRLSIYKDKIPYYDNETKINVGLVVPCKFGDTIDKLNKKATTVCKRLLKYLEDNHSITFDTMYNAFENEDEILKAGFVKTLIGDTTVFYILEVNGFKEE